METQQFTANMFKAPPDQLMPEVLVTSKFTRIGLAAGNSLEHRQSS